MDKRSLQRSQLSNKIEKFKELNNVQNPPSGWIKALRTSLGISLEQIANKLNTTKQNIQSFEKRENEKSITLKSLNDIAEVMDMKLVYALIPKDGSLDLLIARKAEEMAKEIVARTSQTMKLEDQQNSEERIKEALEERKKEIIQKMPKSLWD